MKKYLVPSLALIAFLTLSSHDMFLKMKSFFVQPSGDVTIHLYNGTFDKSENVITRDRMLDVAVVAPDGKRTKVPNSSWSEEGDITVLKTNIGAAGTYVAGVSTKARVFELSAEDFNTYLAHDGILDVLEARKKSDEMDEKAVEKYSKHVKAIFQAGDKQSDNYKVELGYPIEFVPLSNPYKLKVGDELQVKLLRSGKPVANQLTYASHAGYHGHDDSGGHIEAVKTKTNAEGIARIKINTKGHWYIRTIHMEKDPEEGVDYESNWATLTFEIK